MTTPALADDLREILEHTGDLWQALRDTRVYMTGGSGFIGRWMLEALAAADREHRLGVRVVVLSRRPEALAARAPELCAWPALTLVRGDVRDAVELEGTFDHVVHVATVPTPPCDGREVLDVALRGSQRTLEIAVRARATRFLMVSSGAVYGPQPADLEALPEDHAGVPPALAASSANAIGKRGAELMAVLEGEASGFAVTIARGFALLGPYLPLDGQFAAGNFLRDARAGGPIRVRGDGTAVRTYLYTSDLAEWLWTIHLRGRAGAAYNVGGSAPVSIGDLARTIAAVHAEKIGRPVDIRLGAVADPSRTPERFVPSIARARAELGLVPRVGLEEAIRRTLRFLERAL